MRQTDWNDWYAFLTVAELGSYTRAAERLGQPKSSLSVAVQRLEQRLGQRLLERSTRRLSLTEAGTRLRETAAPLFGRLDELAREIAAATDRPQGVLRIATPYEFGSLQLSEVICQVMAQYPDLEVELDVSSGDSLLPLPDYDIQFVITSQDLPDSQHIARRVYSVPRQLYAAPSLLARFGHPSHPGDLSGWPCISGRAETQWLFRDAQGQTHSLTPRAVLRTSNVALRLQAACAGLGVVLMVPSFCLAEETAGRVVRLLPDFPSAHRRIYAYLPDHRLIPAKTRVFMLALEQVLLREQEYEATQMKQARPADAP